MAIIRQTTIDRMEIERDLVVNLRIALEIVEDGQILQQNYHRVSLAPGDNLAAVAAALNADFATRKWPAMQTSQTAVVGQIIGLLWTPAAIAAYKAAHPAQPV